MSRATFLVTVSGPDRIGVGAELFAALHTLEHEDVRLMDVAQITIRGTLVLCAEVSGEPSSGGSPRKADALHSDS